MSNRSHSLDVVEAAYQVTAAAALLGAKIRIDPDTEQTIPIDYVERLVPRKLGDYSWNLSDSRLRHARDAIAVCVARYVLFDVMDKSPSMISLMQELAAPGIIEPDHVVNDESSFDFAIEDTDSQYIIGSIDRYIIDSIDKMTEMSKKTFEIGSHITHELAMKNANNNSDKTMIRFTLYSEDTRDSENVDNVMIMTLPSNIGEIHVEHTPTTLSVTTANPKKRIVLVGEISESNDDDNEDT